MSNDNCYNAEKKVIIYLVMASIIMLYISLFFIHNIVSMGTIVTSTSIEFNSKDEDIKKIKVKQGYTVWEDLEELDLFRNEYFNNEKIIAPGVEGEYTFLVESESSNTYNYNVKFEEENLYGVNMVYKLKRNGEYVLRKRKRI